MVYFRWFGGFILLVLLIFIFFKIGGILLNILLALSIAIIFYDLIKEKLAQNNNG